MSYLDRLKRKICQDAPDTGATKATKGAYVAFVAPQSAPLRQIQASNDDAPYMDDVAFDPASEARRQRVMAMLQDNPSITYAMVTERDRKSVV